MKLIPIFILSTALSTGCASQQEISEKQMMAAHNWCGQFGITIDDPGHKSCAIGRYRDLEAMRRAEKARIGSAIQQGLHNYSRSQAIQRSRGMYR